MILSGEFDATNSVEVGQCLVATWVYTTVPCAKEVIKIYLFENPKFFSFSFYYFGSSHFCLRNVPLAIMRFFF